MTKPAYSSQAGKKSLASIACREAEAKRKAARLKALKPKPPAKKAPKKTTPPTVGGSLPPSPKPTT